MTYSTNFYFAILIATAVGSIVFMIIVTLMQDEIFGQGQAEQVNIIDYRRGTAIIEFQNQILELDVREYSQCVAEETQKHIQRYLDTGAEEDEFLTGNELSIGDTIGLCVLKQWNNQ